MSQGTSWAGASRLLRRDVGDEEYDLASAARKSGMAGSLGGFLGTLGGLALLGPLGIAATPLAMAVAAGGGSLAGSGLGRHFLTGNKTKADLRGEGTSFLARDRGELRDELLSDQLSSAISSATTVGLTSGLGGPLMDKLGKSAIDPDILGEAALEGSDAALGGAGDAFDVTDIVRHNQALLDKPPAKISIPNPFKKDTSSITVGDPIYEGYTGTYQLPPSKVNPVDYLTPGWEDAAGAVRTSRDTSLFDDADDIIRNLG